MTETAAGRRRLGRGLEALLGPTREEAQREGSLVELAIDEIRPNPYQPAQDADQAPPLEELKSPIQQAGPLQPAGGPPPPPADSYELVGREQPLRACQAPG